MAESRLAHIALEALRAEVRRRDNARRDPKTRRLLQPIRGHAAVPWSLIRAVERIQLGRCVRVVMDADDEPSDLECTWCFMPMPFGEEVLCYACRLQERADGHRRAGRPERAERGERYAQALRVLRAGWVLDAVLEAEEPTEDLDG